MRSYNFFIYNENVVKKIIKKSINTLFTVIVFPLILITYMSNYLNSSSGFLFFSKLLALFPGFTGISLRKAYYKSTLQQCGDDLTVEFGSFFTKLNIVLGNNVYIGAYCIISNVELGDDVLIASKVSLLSGGNQHKNNNVKKIVREPVYDKIIIGEKTWIGEGAIVMKNVGKNSIVGAGSVVVKTLGDSITAVGNPAKVI